MSIHPLVLRRVDEAAGPLADLAVSAPATRRPAPQIRPVDRALQKTWQVLAVRDLAQLQKQVVAWEKLAQDAIEPNVFYEAWCLLPAIELYGKGEVEVAFVQELDPGSGGRPRLIGVFPLVYDSSFRGIPCRAARLWKHPHCYLADPLIARDSAEDCWDALLRWLHSRRPRISLLEMPTISSDGPMYHSLMEHLCRRRMPLHVLEFYSRALMRLDVDGEAYLRAGVSGSHRKSFAKKRKHLEELGRLEVTVLPDDGDLDGWMREFVLLEASGWKGQEGTAIACQPSDVAFFSRIMACSLARHRLLLMAMHLDGRMIAAQQAIYAADGAFALKTAYDEALGHDSPGMLLEMEVVQELHRTRRAQWIDCCSAANNESLKRVWKQQRFISSVVCPTGGRWGSLLVSMIPLLTHIRRGIRRFLGRDTAPVRPENHGGVGGEPQPD